LHQLLLSHALGDTQPNVWTERLHVFGYGSDRDLRQGRVTKTLGYGLNDRGSIPVQGQWWDFLLFATSSRPGLGPTQPPSQWARGAILSGVKRVGREAGQSPPSSAEINSAWSYTFTPQYIFTAW